MLTKIRLSAFIVAVAICLGISADTVTTTLDFTSPSDISPYYPGGCSLYSQTTWYSATDSNPWVRTTPVGESNRYGSMGIQGKQMIVLCLCSGSGIRVGIDYPMYIKKIEITCCNTAASLSASTGSLSFNYSSDYSKKYYTWLPDANTENFQVILSVDSFIATISRIVVTYESGTSGIETTRNDDRGTANEPVYDLYGRKLKTMRKGFNIVGGKKLFIR